MARRNEDLLLFFWCYPSVQLALSALFTPLLLNETIEGWLDYIRVFYHCSTIVSALFLLLGLITRRPLLFLPSVAHHALMAMDFLLRTVYGLFCLPYDFAYASTLVEMFKDFPYWKHLLLGPITNVIIWPILAIFCLAVAAVIYDQAQHMEEVSHNIEEANTVCD